MALKKLLGLESMPITEEEIMQKLCEARQRKLGEIEFVTSSRKVKVKLKQVNPAGIMKEDWHYNLAK